MTANSVQNHLIQSKPIRLSVFILGCTVAIISITCSVILWLSFANNTLDSILAFFTAAAMVAASYIFVPVLTSLKEYKRWGLFSLVLVLEFVLVGSSLAASIGWIENNYQNNYQASITSSDSYVNKQDQIKSLTQQINELTAIAAQDRESKTYRGRALRTLSSANALSDKRNLLTQQKFTHSTSNSGGTLANNLGQSRYALWFMFASIVDGVPMACFAVLSASASRTKKANTCPGTSDKTANPTTNAARLQPLITDEQNIYEEIAQEIRDGLWGDKPAMRNIIATKKIRHSQAKEIFKKLVSENEVIQKGNRYERVT